MKIGLLSSYRGQKKYEKEHKAIVEHLKKRGHEVIDSFTITIEQLIPLGWLEREEIFMNFYQKLSSCDIIFAECTVQSTQVGFGLSFLRSKGLPVVILTLRDADEFSPKKSVYSNIENLMFSQYDISDLTDVLDDAVSYMQERIDKRFTIIFPSHLLAKLEQVAQKKKLPKAVYIRSLIEESLKKSSEEA